ncbi:MAG: hypothetical protein R3B57_11605 [Phycisphaerales bacterium]
MATSRATPSPLAPLPGVLAFAFLASLGTGAITNGVYFLAESALGYGAALNFCLAILFGAVYVGVASSSGRGIRRAAQRRSWITTRGALGASAVLVAAACVMPSVGAWLSGQGATPAWTFWVLIVLFAIASGVLWPVCEAYVSGGRHDRQLRSAMGRFNLAWSSATIVALWLMGPLVKEHATLVLLGVGASHVIGAGLLVWFPRDPAPREHHHSDLTPESRRRSVELLAWFRVLLPLSYLLKTALLPQLPAALATLDTDPSWKPLIGSTYFVARFLGFGLFERWHGWHGRRAMPILGAVLLATGFIAGVLAPLAPSPDTGVTLLIVSLVVFGFGGATVYSGAIFYAMEAGDSDDVDSGGAHEAFIGLGYTLGPLCGLGAVALASTGLIQYETAMVALTLVVAILFGFSAPRLLRPRARGKL